MRITKELTCCDSSESANSRGDYQSEFVPIGIIREAPEVDFPGMRKRLIRPDPQTDRSHDEGCFDFTAAAVVEVTSEEEDGPVESALISGEARGWQAARTGAQMIRVIFDEPQALKLTRLESEAKETRRTQEFVLRWSPEGGYSVREIVRQ